MFKHKPSNEEIEQKLMGLKPRSISDDRIQKIYSHAKKQGHSIERDDWQYYFRPKLQENSSWLLRMCASVVFCVGIWSYWENLSFSSPPNIENHHGTEKFLGVGTSKHHFEFSIESVRRKLLYD